MKWYIYVVSLIIIIIIIFVYAIFNGTPWEKATYREQAIEYVHQKYDGAYSYKSVSYDYKTMNYSAYFYLDDTKKEFFRYILRLTV